MPEKNDSRLPKDLLPTLTSSFYQDANHERLDEFPASKQRIAEETKKFIDFNRDNRCLLILED